MTYTRPRACLIIGLVGFWSPPALSAQVIQGVIRERATGLPVADARVLLLNAGRETMHTVYTDRTGQFTLPVPSAGEYYVRINRIGLRPLLEGPLTLTTTDSLSVTYVLQALPVQLDSITVAAVAYERYLAEVGYYRRERAGFGVHINQDWIERHGAVVSRTTDLIRMVPALSVGGCRSPRYYVDDVEVQGINEVVLPPDVLAIEIYRRWTETPPRYGRGCVVLIWTRWKASRRN